TVDDDSPIINAASVQNGVVDEERLTGGNAGDSYGDGGDLTPAQGDDGNLTASGSLGISYGVDGPASTAMSAGTAQSLTFNGPPVGNSITVGNFTASCNQGFVNTSGTNGQIFGTQVNVTDNAGVFTVGSFDVGLFGTGPVKDVTLIGLDSLGNTVATYTVHLS